MDTAARVGCVAINTFSIPSQEQEASQLPKLEWAAEMQNLTSTDSG